LAREGNRLESQDCQEIPRDNWLDKQIGRTAGFTVKDRWRYSMKRVWHSSLISLILLIGCNSLVVAQGYTPAADRMAWYQKHVEMKATSEFKDLEWQFLGPTNVSGRVTDVAATTPRGNTYTIYAATASGGVWKTDNEGTTWNPVFEHGVSTSVGDVTISPSNQDIVWIGLGEANIFRSSMAGAGVYKSTDAGKTWTHMGLATAHTIPRIIVHPANPDIVYVADSGHEWTDNPERGLYKTTDGGKTWERVLYVDEKTGVIDLVMDSGDPETLYAATWQRIRKRWNDPRNEPDYTGSGIHKSTDGGKTWRTINQGLPDPHFRGRIGIDQCSTQPNVVYAFIDNYDIAGKQPGDVAAKDGDAAGSQEEEKLDSYGRPRQKVIKGAEVYRSKDSGETWNKVSESDDYMTGLSATYGWVFGQIRVDPNDAETIYVMGLALNVSNDGGKSFRRLGGMHGDHHALWINPEDSRYLINGNDGGINISYDAGESWRLFTDQIPVVQFFNVMYDMDSPFHVYGSIQDHGSMRGEISIFSDRDGTRRMRPVEWENAPGGEGCSHAIDPTDSNTVYSAGFYGQISRTELAENERTSLLPKPDPDAPPLRGQWIAPFVLSPHNPRVLYHGMNFLYRSMNRGEAMHKISPDLTNNRVEEIGDIPYQTISTISESPFQFGVIYVGTDDGNLHVTHDCGLSWNRINQGIQPNRWISRVVASRHTDGTVYMSQNGKRNDDMTPYLWKSTDFGKTWQSIVANIPSGPINVVREDPKNKGVLYVGTDLGVYVSNNGGETWHVLANNLPTTFVSDLVIHPRDDVMVISTHGRGMWGMDVRTIQDPDYKPAPNEDAPPRRRRRGGDQ
jgi:photosystem II stability/assembly factor-like uncharacterized protein